MVWSGADAMRGVFEVVKWPIERLIWLLERGVVWPLEEQADKWGPSLRLLAITGLALLAAAAGVLGLVWASGNGGGSSVREAAAPAPTYTPSVRSTAIRQPALPAKPVLHGAKPDFTAQPPAGSGGSHGGDGAPAKAAVNSTSEVATSGTAAAGAATSSAPAESPGPAATKVAHQFTSAFVLYEIGHETAAVRHAFTVTATPRLTEKLLKNPPRLPANVKVPKAKVLNIVAGPRHGDTYTLSASLLRVGVTSELRLTVERAADGSWQVANILG